MDNERTIHNLRLQLRIERALILLVALFFTARWVCGMFSDAKSLILVNGKPIVCVPSENDANAILDKIRTDTGCNPSEIKFREEVHVARAPRDASPVSRHMAMRMARRAISPVFQRWAIIVNGKPLVALPSQKAAGETLDLAKLRFGKLAANLLEEPQFKENVTVDLAPVSPDIYRKTAKQAVESLFAAPQPARRDAVYIVEKGDVASAIAEKYGLGLAELCRLNPKMNLNRLQIGDKIFIKKTEAQTAKLTVIVRDLQERTEVTTAPIQRVSSAALYSGKTAEISSGRSGLRKVRLAVIYENGRKVGSEILEEKAIRKPMPQRIAVGIKPRPTW